MTSETTITTTTQITTEFPSIGDVIDSQLASVTSPSATKKAAFSLEVFPARTPEGFEKLKTTLRALSELSPAYIDVTYGA